MNKREQTATGMVLLKICSVLTMVVFIIPTAALLFDSIRFVLSEQVSALNLLSKTLPLFGATLKTSLMAILFSTPLSLLFAIYTVEYASSENRQHYTAMFKTLRDIPTVILGLFALQFILPLFFGTSETLALETNFLLTVSFVLALFITPFITSKLIFSLEKSIDMYRHTALSLGATRTEALWKMILPHSLRNITALITLGFSRVVGEALIVGMIKLKPQTMAGYIITEKRTILESTNMGMLSTLGILLFVFILILHIFHGKIIDDTKHGVEP